MQRNLKVLIANMLMIMLFSNFSSVRSSEVEPKMSSISSTSSMCANYIWYKDEEMTEMTGTYTDINIEINRLSLLFPGYTFSTYHTSGLYEYEYGYNSSLPIAIIYSNR